MNSAKRFDMFRMFFSVLIALLISFVIIFFVSEEPVTAIATLITGPFKSKRNMGNVIESMVPLIFTGTGVCIMFSANQINLATEGGFHLGGLVAAAVALKLGLPAGLSPVAAICLAALAGAAFCTIPAIMKIKTGSPELVSSLMINYLSLWLCTFILMYTLQDPSVGSASYKLPAESELPIIIGGTNIHVGLLLALLVAVLGYVFLFKTRTGYELRLTGENESFARYSGINIVKVVLISQMVGGMIAGMGGGVELFGVRLREAIAGFGTPLAVNIRESGKGNACHTVLVPEPFYKIHPLEMPVGTLGLAVKKGVDARKCLIQQRDQAVAEDHAGFLGAQIQPVLHFQHLPGLVLR